MKNKLQYNDISFSLFEILVNVNTVHILCQAFFLEGCFSAPGDESSSSDCTDDRSGSDEGADGNNHALPSTSATTATTKRRR